MPCFIKILLISTPWRSTFASAIAAHIPLISDSLAAVAAHVASKAYGFNRSIRSGQIRKGLTATAHGFDEFFVRLGLGDLIEQELHRIDRVHRMEHFAENPEAIEDFLRKKHFFLTRRGLIDVQARENALFHELAIEVDFGVTGSFEFFENHFVHAGAGFNQRGGDDRQRAAFFDVSSRAEETLRLVKRVGIHAAGEDLA